MYDNPKIMLIDDNEVDCFLTKCTFMENEFSQDITMKYSGIEALNYLHSCKDAPEKWPDMIFVNLNMPHIGAYEFLKRFEELPKDMRDYCSIFILLDPDDPQEASPPFENEKVLGFVDKPIINIDLDFLSKQVMYAQYRSKI